MKTIKNLMLLALCLSSAVFAGQTGSQPQDRQDQGTGGRVLPAVGNCGAAQQQAAANAGIPEVATFEDEDPSSMPPAGVVTGQDAWNGQEESQARMQRLREAARNATNHALLMQARTTQARLSMPSCSTSQSVAVGSQGCCLSAYNLTKYGLRPADRVPRNVREMQILYQAYVAKVEARVNGWFDGCVDVNNGANGWPVWAEQVASPHSVTSTSVATQGGSSSPRAIQSPVDEELCAGLEQEREGL